MSAPQPRSQPRFEALLYRRSPFISFLFQELEWWTTKDKDLIATITIETQFKKAESNFKIAIVVAIRLGVTSARSYGDGSGLWRWRGRRFGL